MRTLTQSKIDQDLLLAFVDTRPEAGFPDELQSLDELRRFAPHAASNDLVEARAVRDALAVAVLGSRQRGILEFNHLCERLDVRPQVLASGTVTWRLNSNEQLTPLLTRLLAAAVDLWVSGDIDRVQVCAAGSCIVPFVDTSPRHNRDYCSATCATRSRVQRYREHRGTN